MNILILYGIITHRHTSGDISANMTRSFLLSQIIKEQIQVCFEILYLILGELLKNGKKNHLTIFSTKRLPEQHGNKTHTQWQ